MNIKILVAAHKTYQMPGDDIYLPIHTGKKGKDIDLGYIGDDTGDNISDRNSYYCELTGIYWAWKNLDADYIGSAHYRRHFIYEKKGDKWASVLNRQEAEKLCGEFEIIVPNKRRYYIETNYSHYVHAHQSEGLDMMLDIIKKDYPDYVAGCDIVMNRTWAHMFNMFIMRKDYFDSFCAWMFDILFKIEKKVDISRYSSAQARAFMDELMLDVWLEANGYKYKEIPVAFMEKQNWIVKGGKFVLRKLGIREKGI